MKVADNFSEAHMLFSEPVTFTLYEDDNQIPLTTFKMKLPTIHDLYFDEDVRLTIGLLNMDITEIQSKFKNVPGLNTHFNLYDTLATQTDANLIRYLNILVTTMQKLGINFTLADTNYKQMLCNGIPVTEKLFERMRQLILISCGIKKQTDFYSDPRMKAMQDKINKIKNNNKPQSDAIKKSDFSECYIVLLYEFGLAPSEIYNLTQYAVNYILGYTSKSIRYKASLIAVGNGNTKKVKFITDKGK